MKDKFLSQQSQYFDKFADEQTGKSEETQNTALKIEYQTFLNFLGDLKGKKVLDLGCGTGRYSRQLAPFAEEVVGMDISSQSVNLAIEKAKQQGLDNFRGIVGDFKTQEFTDYFDIVICVNVIHHTDDIDDIFQNIKKSLKRGGKFVIFEQNSLNLLFIPFLIKTGHFKSHFNKLYFRSNIFSLKNMIKRNGFELTKSMKYGYFPTMLYNISLGFKKLNEILNKIPLINVFNAFYILELSKK